eukprot:g6369.t1
MSSLKCRTCGGPHLTFKHASNQAQSLCDTKFASLPLVHILAPRCEIVRFNSLVPACIRGDQVIMNLIYYYWTSSWVLIFRQTVEEKKEASESLNEYWPEQVWLIRENEPQASCYSILPSLGRFCGADGKFLLKMVWPQKGHSDGRNSFNIWKQTTNPTCNSMTVEGYEAVDVSFASIGWNGLKKSVGKTAKKCLLKGGKDPFWYFAIGMTKFGAERFKGFIPGGEKWAGETQTELFVFNE